VRKKTEEKGERGEAIVKKKREGDSL